MGDYRKLEVWRRSRSLAAAVYRATADFPSAERYGLTAQIRRAVVSVAANLAEGCGSRGDTELRRFLRISLGSLSELECELLLARDFEFLGSGHWQALNRELAEIRGMLLGLHDSLAGSQVIPD